MVSNSDLHGGVGRVMVGVHTGTASVCSNSAAVVRRRGTNIVALDSLSYWLNSVPSGRSPRVSEPSCCSVALFYSSSSSSPLARKVGESGVISYRRVGDDKTSLAKLENTRMEFLICQYTCIFCVKEVRIQG